MESSSNFVKRPWLALLAVVAFVSETGAWWWAAQLPNGAARQGPTLLALVAGLGALAASLVLWRQLATANQKVRRTRQLLASSLDTLNIGLEIWDQQNRLLLYNKKINQLNINFHTPEHIGQTFEALVRAKLARQEIPAAIGREEQWLAQHLATRGAHKEPRLKNLMGDLWVKTYEIRTPEGYLVTSWVDVTEEVRQQKILEASNQRLVEQSSMDELTGLANRRRFYEALVTEWQRAARSSASLSLLMVDIDHFKQFNDNYGHVAGDECLRRVAAVLEHCVRRAGEMVARYGGEEFVLLLPGADLVHACETAQKCLELMEQEVMPHIASPTADHVTFSIGVACLLPDATLEPASLVNAADTAMYRAKSAGRARFEVADQADWEIDKDTPRSRPAPLS